MNVIQEYVQFQPHILGLLGFTMQYARAHTKFKDWGYHLIALGLATFGYVLFHNIDLSDWRRATIHAMIGVSAAVLPIWGGTLAASNMAKAGAKFIPITNSK